MYHSIASVPKSEPLSVLHVSSTEFSWQMRLLKLLGYRGVSMTELMPYLKGEKTGRVVGITFDDGYENNLTHALPILKKYDFTATCYIVTNEIGGYNSWDEKHNVPANPIMNLTQIKQWLKEGMEIGAHTQNHIDLTMSDTTVCREEIEQSKIALEKAFDTRIDHFCYPYGKYFPEHTHLLSTLGIISATTMLRGRATSSSPLLELPRVTIKRKTNPLSFLIKLLTNYECNKRKTKKT